MFYKNCNKRERYVTEVMFRINIARLSSLRNSNHNIFLHASCCSLILTRKWSQFQRCDYAHLYSCHMLVYKRWFKAHCCASDKHETVFDGNKIISGYIDSRITIGDINENIKKASNIYTNITRNSEISELDYRMPHAEFLGIEVFPEIFDQLPPKCTGCGAILQSENKNKPGYIPENRDPNLSRNSEGNSFLPEVICARCFSLKHYNKDVAPLVLPQEISNFLTHICRRKALILYVVDVMDIPGSFAEDILRIVGETKHIMLVCNKIDQLPVDGHPKHQIQHVRNIISDEAMKFGLQNAKIQGVNVISAKTGLGIYDLVKAINKHWGKNSDLYLVGCHNSGKTTLFNLLVDLFTASRHSDNMLQRGTVSPNIGTTLSLLRYPITKYRFLRLQDRLKSGYTEVRFIDS